MILLYFLLCAGGGALLAGPIGFLLGVIIFLMTAH